MLFVGVLSVPLRVDLCGWLCIHVFISTGIHTWSRYWLDLGVWSCSNLASIKLPDLALLTTGWNTDSNLEIRRKCIQEKQSFGSLSDEKFGKQLLGQEI